MIRKNAFTLVEMAMTTLVAGIITVAAMPTSDSSSKEQARQAALKIESDVNYARSLAIAVPSDPALIKFDDTANTYWIAKNSAQDTPITHPVTKQPYKTTFGAGTSMPNVQLYAADFGGDKVLKFDSMGRTDQTTTAVLQITAGTASTEILIAPGTGQATDHVTFTKSLTPFASATAAVAVGG